ncbi:MAG TPA: hypothetical protein VJ778_01345 [Burkholderiales bacterium]|nr:hypothetical protein [Burkholderiales bacterium]
MRDSIAVHEQPPVRAAVAIFAAALDHDFTELDPTLQALARQLIYYQCVEPLDADAFASALQCAAVDGYAPLPRPGIGPQQQHDGGE